MGHRLSGQSIMLESLFRRLLEMVLDFISKKMIGLGEDLFVRHSCACMD